MKLKYLIKDTSCTIVSGNDNLNISNITINSKEANEDSLFVCIKGAKTDGHNYINDAVNHGAKAVLVEKVPEEQYDNVTIIKTDDSEKELSYITGNLYDHPADKLTIIAVTGTKGKTTVSSMIHQILNKAGIACGYIGSMGIQYQGKHIETHNTTPDSLVLNQVLNDMVNSGCSHVVLEASSQAFKRKRLEGINFEIGAFLNIGHDHIGEGEHENFEEYLNCKKELLNQSEKNVINKNLITENYLNENEIEHPITFSSKEKADYQAENITPVIENDFLGTEFELKNFKNQKFRLSLPGLFNIDNALAAIIICTELGIDKETIYKALKDIRINGRSELLKNPLKYNKTVFIDFAHNELSMKSILKDLRDYNPKRLIVLFGLEWDDTKIRRYDEGFNAGKYSDLAILTSHNTLNESFESINEDTIRGLEESKANYIVIKDREEAIKYALDIANKDDIVVLAGMGSYHTLNINGNKFEFSERQIVDDYLKEKFETK